jgi:hypothetical protein
MLVRDAGGSTPTKDASVGVVSGEDASTDDGASSGPPALTNTCTRGTISIGSDILNPGDVYLVGNIAPYGDYALTHWSDANRACLGFPMYGALPGAQIRPTDGRLVYLDLEGGPKLREFHGDVCPTTSSALYPSNPAMNDPILPDPGCAPHAGASGMLVSSDGETFTACYGFVYDSAGVMVYDAQGATQLLAVGHDRLALLGPSSPEIGSLRRGDFIAVSALAQQQLIAWRERDSGGFLVAVETGQSTFDADLWAIDPDGTATRMGPFPPVSQMPDSFNGSAALDGCGALIQIGSSVPAGAPGIIVRREVGSDAQVVYTDMNKLVYLHTPSLVTGP